MALDTRPQGQSEKNMPVNAKNKSGGDLSEAADVFSWA